MTAVSFLVCALFARGGGVLTGRGYTAAERAIGWSLVGLAVAGAMYVGSAS